MKKYTIRQAKAQDAVTLTEIAVRSKSYWGYSPEYFQVWLTHLNLTPQFIELNISYVAQIQEVIKGFWLRTAQEELSEGRLFVEPSDIGKGCGKALWHAVMAEAKQRGLRYVTIESDRNALGFYLKMGAQMLGMRASQFVPGVQLPIVRVYL